MDENKENEPVAENILAPAIQNDLKLDEQSSNTEKPNEVLVIPRNSMPKLGKDQKEYKAAFNKLLHKTDVNRRLAVIAKCSKIPKKTFIKHLLGKLCDGTLTWNGVIAISFGFVNFGSVFFFRSFSCSSVFHKAILATHERIQIPCIKLLEPEDAEYYRELETSLLVIFSQTRIHFITDTASNGTSEWDPETNTRNMESFSAGVPLQFNAVISIARACEKVGTPELVDVANSCYAWLKSRKMAQGICIEKMYQRQQWNEVIDVCTQRFLDSLASEKERQKYETYKADAEKKLKSEAD